MNLRRLRTSYLPFATKAGLLTLLNPALRGLSARASVQRRIETVLRRHGIEHLDLGGYMPVEGYLTIHLSPVEAYGFPSCPQTTFGHVFDEATQRATLRARPLAAPAVCLHFDVTQGLPLPAGRLRGINMSHFLEHFPREEGERFLQECHRVLSPGGILRLSCPDLGKYARAYVARDEAFFTSVSGPSYCCYDRLQTFGDRFISKAYDNHNGHRWFYDAESACCLLARVGFSQPEERRLHESALPRIGEIEPAYRERESFYVEAVR